MNFYPFHLGDYHAHTGHLEPFEDLAYRRMLDAYYLREGALPKDPAEVARLIRMRANVAEVKAVLAEFFQEQDDGWHHGRCDVEIAKYQAMVNGGKKGAATRWGDKQDGGAMPGVKPPHAPPNANQEPRTITKNHKKKDTPLHAARFDEFWNSWPKSERKQDRAKCLAKWVKDKLDDLADLILADLEVKKQTQKWREDGGRYIEAPLVYLNNRRWEDGVTPMAAGQQTLDPDSRAAVEAEGIAMGIGPWDDSKEHWPSYKARVRGRTPPAFNPAIASMVATGLGRGH